MKKPDECIDVSDVVSRVDEKRLAEIRMILDRAGIERVNSEGIVLDVVERVRILARKMRR